MSEKITITHGGASRTLFMSFGLLNELTGMVNAPENIAFISLDPYLRAQVLKAVLSERDEEGMITTEVNLNTLDVSREDIQKVLGWVEEAVMDFFMSALTRLRSIQEKYGHLLPNTAAGSTPTSNGSEA